jgi:hypothetical protein
MDEYIILHEELEALKKSRSYAVLRRDLEEEGLSPATSMGHTEIDWTIPHRCHQPDRLDDEEFNMFVWIPVDMSNKTWFVIVVNTIDFEWLHDRRW